jgi:hypothetical protein
MAGFQGLAQFMDSPGSLVGCHASDPLLTPDLIRDIAAMPVDDR